MDRSQRTVPSGTRMILMVVTIEIDAFEFAETPLILLVEFP